MDKALAGALGLSRFCFAWWGEWARELRRTDSAESPVDSLHPVVVSVQPSQWFFHQLRHAVRVPRAIRDRHGRSVVGGHAAGARTLARPPARHSVGAPGRRILLGIHAGSGGFQVLYPLVNASNGPGWRAFFWLGAAPALLALWIALRVKESPVWLARRSQMRRTINGTDFNASGFLSVWWAPPPDFAPHGRSHRRIIRSIFWYPTFLREAGLPAIPYLIALNVGAILGTALWGRVSETRAGQRGAATWRP